MNLPTKITVVRLALIPLIIAAFCLEETIWWMFIVSAGLFFVASVTDFLDGYIARKYNMVTTMGKFLDPIADKILTITSLIIGIASNHYRLGIPYYMEVCSIVIIAREFIISLFRQIAASKKVILAADMTGKWKTTFGMIGLNSLLFIPFRETMVGHEAACWIYGEIMWWFAIVFISGCTILTVYSGWNYIWKNRQVFKEKKVKVDLMIERNVDIKDEKIFDTMRKCIQENRIDVPFIQKCQDDYTYARALEIALWYEIMGLTKGESYLKRTMDITLKDVDKLEKYYLARKEKEAKEALVKDSAEAKEE